MVKRLQVLLDEEEYQEIQVVARRQRLTMAEWVRQALRRAKDDQPGTAEAKLRAIADASRHSFPTADIETMLAEIEAGQQRLRDIHRLQRAHVPCGRYPSNKDRALALLTQIVGSGEQLVTDVEVYQEILHRYTAINRPEAIDAAFESLDAVTDDILTFGMTEIRAARTLIHSLNGLSARDALHVAVMHKADQSNTELRQRLRCLPRHRAP